MLSCVHWTHFPKSGSFGMVSQTGVVECAEQAALEVQPEAVPMQVQVVVSHIWPFALHVAPQAIASQLTP